MCRANTVVFLMCFFFFFFCRFVIYFLFFVLFLFFRTFFFVFSPILFWVLHVFFTSVPNTTYLSCNIQPPYAYISVHLCTLCLCLLINICSDMDGRAWNTISKHVIIIIIILTTKNSSLFKKNYYNATLRESYELPTKIQALII